MRAMFDLVLRFAGGVFTAVVETFNIKVGCLILLVAFLSFIGFFIIRLLPLRLYRRVLGNFSKNLFGFFRQKVEITFEKKGRKNELEILKKDLKLIKGGLISILSGIKSLPSRVFISLPIHFLALFCKFARGYSPPDPFVPKEHDAGGGDFVKIGKTYLDIFKDACLAVGMKKDRLAGMNILDIGCGRGRMAHPIREFFKNNTSESEGSYIGFDIDACDIQWCRKTYNKTEGFEFFHSDVYNERYNEIGTICATDYVFKDQALELLRKNPDAEKEGLFDFVFLTSVFTHMAEPAVENYFKQIAQVLKPGGICVITWFLLDEVSRSKTNSKHSWFSCRHLFKHPCEDSKHAQCEVKGFPEAAIAYDIKFVEKLYDNSGLEIIGDIKHGHWARPRSENELQDLIVAIKPKKPSP